MYHCGIPNMPPPEAAHMMWQHWRHFMPYDLEETDDTYIITMPLPGYESKDIQISVRESEISIEANPPEAVSDSDEKKLPRQLISNWSLIWHRPIQVKIPVNDPIDESNVKARLQQGLLHVSFMKLPKKKIPVEEIK